MTEIWKDIKGYEGRYQVSNMGRVKRLARVCNCGEVLDERILKTRPTRGGYPLILLRESDGGRRRGHSVHRLVATAFLPNPDNLPQVNHKNEDRTDNRSVNLEWCTAHYNMHYGNCQRRIFEGQHFKPVDQYTKDGKFITHYKSVSDCSRATGISTGRISAICNRRGFSSKGFTFKYSDNGRPV